MQKKILIIEDNPDDILIIKRILSKTPEFAEADLVAATSGKEGLNLLEKGQFDCLILDYLLPDTNALELLKTIIKTHQYLPTIILTGLKDDRLLAGALKLGALDFLTKDQINILPKIISQVSISGQRSQFIEQMREHLYEEVIDSMGEGLFALDLTQTIVLVNQRLIQLIGFKEDELLGKSLQTIIGNEAGKVFVEKYPQIVAGKPQTFKITLVSKTKDRIPTLITQTPLFDGEGNFNGSLVLVADLTELKEMEAKLIEAEKLAAMAQLAYEAVHEIRNPLTIIKLGIYNLKNTLPPEKRSEDDFLLIERAIERMSFFLNDLLNFARPVKLNLNLISINPLIRQVIEHTAQRTFPNIKFQLELSDELSEIKIDYERIKQVFINLIKNACEAMHEVGTLKIDTKRVNDFIQITFEDTGVGIPEKNLSEIFNPFFTTKKDKGTGLGLAICKRIIETHQGEIKVESKVGQGASFYVLLPVT
ncbi:MAG: ATP-binding protein [bacterium]